MVFAIHFEKFTNNLQKTIYFGNFGYVIHRGKKIIFYEHAKI